MIAGLIAVAGCLITAHLLLPGTRLSPAHGYPLVTLAHAATLRAATGSVLYLILIGLLALGVATAIRDTAASIGALLALLYLPPLLAQAVSDPLRRHIQQIAPMTAGLAIQATTNLRNLPITPWAGLGVLTAWAAASPPPRRRPAPTPRRINPDRFSTSQPAGTTRGITRTTPKTHRPPRPRERESGSRIRASVSHFPRHLRGSPRVGRRMRSLIGLTSLLFRVGVRAPGGGGPSAAPH